MQKVSFKSKENQGPPNGVFCCCSAVPCRLAPAADFFSASNPSCPACSMQVSSRGRRRFGLLSRHEILPAPPVPCRLAPAAAFLFQHPFLSVSTNPNLNGGVRMLRFGLLSRHEILPAPPVPCRLAPAAAFLFQHPLLTCGANPHLNGGVCMLRFGLLSRHELLPAPPVPCRLAPAAACSMQVGPRTGPKMGEMKPIQKCPIY